MKYKVAFSLILKIKFDFDEKHIYVQSTRQFRVSYEINDACFFKRKIGETNLHLLFNNFFPPNYDKIQEFF